MKILIVNKFLYPNGGSETYIFNLAKELENNGHEVQFFGMEHEKRCVGNHAESYTANMDFHKGSVLAKLFYPISTIYSRSARKKIRKVLLDFESDVVHLNNFNFQITPSIILEIRKFEKTINKEIKIVYTAHDYQLICPNHMLNNPKTHQNCEKCVSGKFSHCFKGKCIHGSALKSLIGSAEGYFWKKKKVYAQLDCIICPTKFIKSKLDINPVLAEKTVILQNFVELLPLRDLDKEDYVLYFGRYSEEKGIKTLLEACRKLPEINFVFAGSGVLESDFVGIDNIKNVGFLSGYDLENLISKARFSVYPSTWYENCPYSVIESQLLGTPVIGANIGGIPELIVDGVTGELFESGNAEQLANKIKTLFFDLAKCEEYSENCKKAAFVSASDYYEKLVDIYGITNEIYGEEE